MKTWIDLTSKHHVVILDLQRLTVGTAYSLCDHKAKMLHMFCNWLVYWSGDR